MSGTDTVRAAFDAYLAQDRDAAERLLAGNFTCTSPRDDHIGKAAFASAASPRRPGWLRSGSWNSRARATTAGDDGVFVLHEYEPKAGGRYRNAEFSTVRDGQLAQTQVFFGGQVSPG